MLTTISTKEHFLGFLKNHKTSFEHALKNYVDLQDDEEVVFEFIKFYPNGLEDSSERLQNDLNFIFKAVKENGAVFQFVKPEFKKNKELFLTAFESEHDALKHADESIKNDIEFAKRLAVQFPMYLEHLGKEVQDSKEVVMLSVKQGAWSLEFASNRLKDDPEIFLTALQKDETVFKYIGENLKSNKKFLLKALKKYGDGFIYIQEELKND